jgi:hypothetical protein
MKVVHNSSKEVKSKAKLIEANDFSKSFEYGDIKLFIGKAFDEETDKHFVILSLPEIAEVNAHNVQFPVDFNSEKERDDAFYEMNEQYAEVVIGEIVREIKQRNAETEKVENQKKLEIEVENLRKEVQELKDENFRLLKENEKLSNKYD